MSTLDALRRAALREVVVDVDGAYIAWRLRRLTHEDSLRAGGGVILAAATTLGADFGEQDKAEQARRLQLLGSSMEPEELLARKGRVEDACICASVVAVKGPEDEDWQPMRLVLDLAQEDAAKGVLHISVLTPAMHRALSGEVQALTQGEGVAEALGYFRESGGGADAEPA
jgi:hypothetical protein